MFGTGISAFALQGTDEDGRELLSLVALPLETRLTSATLTKEAIEDLQFFNFYTSAQLAGWVPGLVSHRRPPTDPPDLIVQAIGKSELAIELTTLSTTQVTRQRLAEMRSIGRLLDQKIAEDLAAYQHLTGRVVALAEMGGDDTRPPRRSPKQLREFVDQLAAEVRTDFGVVQGIPVDDPSAGLPERITAEIANQGRKFFQDYSVEVHESGIATSSPAVITNVQITFYLDMVRKQLVRAIETKDDPRNQILLISTGLVDTLGYVVPGDQFLFNLVVDLVKDGLKFIPNHLNQVILHHWRSDHILVLYERAGSDVLVDTSQFQELGPAPA